LPINVDVAKILDFLKLEDQPEKADVIFILGGSSLAPVIHAAQLYNDGYAPTIAFISIGGRFGGDHVWGIPEYLKYREILNDLGIPSNSVIFAGLSTNTLEEARLAIPFLKESGINPTKVILVARPIHQRRAWATFSKQQPTVKFINCPADEPDANTELSRLVAEIDRLIVYGTKGNLLARPIPDEILKSIDKIREAQLE
jgi:uncharacterized SAM-binding protein YcdF (DUF218 family)